EAIAGGSINIPTIDGQVKLKVPPGSQSGQTLRLKGKGAINIKTKQRGNLMAKLVIKVPVTDDKEIIETVKKLDGFYGKDVRSGITI
ncbi:MAG TPA: J domain-containing protein, partial [Deltaproteobacteria bacterium]|nr:J domain-containing protein [Deltaproteobacteria bacterium]